MTIYPIIEHAMQIWIIVIAFQSNAGIRHIGQMQFVFTNEDACETYAKQVIFDNHKKIPGLYWFCEEVEINP